MITTRPIEGCTGYFNVLYKGQVSPIIVQNGSKFVFVSLNSTVRAAMTTQRFTDKTKVKPFIEETLNYLITNRLWIPSN